MWPACGFQAPEEGRLISHHFGGHSERETPLPIPNRVVKPLSADGTWPARAWESRSPPINLRAVPWGRPVFVWAFVRAGRDRRPRPPARSAPAAPAVCRRSGRPGRVELADFGHALRVLLDSGPCPYLQSF